MPTFREDLHLGHAVPTVDTDDITAKAITEDKMADDSISTRCLQDGSVTEPKLADGAVSTRTIQDGAVTAEKLADGSVGLNKISDEVYKAFDSIKEGGIMLAQDFGERGGGSEVLGISQKKLTEEHYRVDDELQGINKALGEDDSKGTVRGRLTDLEDTVGDGDLDAGTVRNRIYNLETAVGEGGSVDERINIERDRAIDAETALANGIEGLTQSNIVVGSLPQSGEANTIYRVPGVGSYTDYAWNGSDFIPLAEYDNATDDVPTANSNNLVKSGGVYSSLYTAVPVEEREDITSEFSFTDGRGVLQSGPLSDEYSQYAYSNFVNIEGADKIEVRIPVKPKISSNIGVAFYTSNAGYLSGNCLGGKRSDSSSTNYARLLTQSVILDVPSGAKYIATSWFSSDIIENYGPATYNFYCKTVTVSYSSSEKYVRVEDYRTAENKIEQLESVDNAFDNWKNGTDELLYGSENVLSFMDGETIKGKKITTSATYASGSGYLASSPNANIYVYNLSPYAGKHIFMRYSYVSNAYKYLILSDYEILSSLTKETQGDMSEYVIVNGGKGYPATASTTTLTIPESPCYLVLNPYFTQYGYPEITVVEDSTTGLISRVDNVEEIIGGLDGIRKEMREGFLNMNYTSVNSINDVWLKYSSQTPVGAKFGLRNVLALSGAGTNSIQSSAIYNNILIIFTTTGSTFIVNTDTMNVIRSGNLIVNDGSHHNSAAFCNEFYDEEDDLPILMLMGNGGDATTPAEVLLFRVVNSNGVYDMQRIGSLYFPLSSVAFKNNAGACNVNFWDGKLLAEYRYTANGVSTIRMATFTMPTIGDLTNVYLSDSDILDEWEAFPSTIMQDSFVDGDIMYIGSGGGYGVTYYDLLNKQAVNTIIPKNINSYYGEMESNFVYNNRLYLVGYSSNRTVRGVWLFDARTM